MADARLVGQNLPFLCTGSNLKKRSHLLHIPTILLRHLHLRLQTHVLNSSRTHSHLLHSTLQSCLSPPLHLYLNYKKKPTYSIPPAHNLLILKMTPCHLQHPTPISPAWITRRPTACHLPPPTQLKPFQQPRKRSRNRNQTCHSHQTYYYRTQLHHPHPAPTPPHAHSLPLTPSKTPPPCPKPPSRNPP